MKFIKNIRIRLVGFLLLTTTIVIGQNNYPLIVNKQIFIEKSFNDIIHLYPKFKWYTSTFSPESTKTYILNNYPFDIYVTYLDDGMLNPIISQTIIFWGNKVSAENYFNRVINSLKGQGGYTKLYDREYSPDVCQFFYSNFKINLFVKKFKNSTYIVDIIINKDND